jgi:hypothetical protein
VAQRFEHSPGLRWWPRLALCAAGALSCVLCSANPAIASLPMCINGHPTCVGDCGVDRQVTLDEILTLVNVALGNIDASECLAGDANHDNQVTVDEILTAVNHALNGCG